jgi:hypothetical protein
MVHWSEASQPARIKQQYVSAESAEALRKLLAKEFPNRIIRYIERATEPDAWRNQNRKRR